MENSESWAQTGQYVGAGLAALLQVAVLLGIVYLVVRMFRKRGGGSK